jgi:hypothetical protein
MARHLEVLFSKKWYLEKQNVQLAAYSWYRGTGKLACSHGNFQFTTVRKPSLQRLVIGSIAESQ